MRRVAAALAGVLLTWVAAAAQQSSDDQSAPAAEQSKPEPSKPEQSMPEQPAPPTAAQNSICLLVESAARANGLPVEFFARVIWQESRFRADAVGPATKSGQHALGIAQFMPGTAAERDLLDPMDPVQALPKSAEFLRDLRAQFGNLGLAAAAYNAGPRRVREWIDGTGPMPSQTRSYVEAITGASVEQWAKASEEPDRKQGGGRSCGDLVALLKREPNRFVAALEQHIVSGTSQPWGAILGADRSRDRILTRYAEMQQRHAAILADRDPILIERRRGPLPRYQVRVGADTRAAANELCSRMHKDHGDCVVLRNPRG